MLLPRCRLKNSTRKSRPADRVVCCGEASRSVTFFEKRLSWRLTSILRKSLLFVLCAVLFCLLCSVCCVLCSVACVWRVCSLFYSFSWIMSTYLDTEDSDEETPQVWVIVYLSVWIVYAKFVGCLCVWCDAFSVVVVQCVHSEWGRDRCHSRAVCWNQIGGKHCIFCTRLWSSCREIFGSSSNWRYQHTSNLF
jgi:hypothetical protein